MKIAIAATVLTGWNHPHPLFSYAPGRAERAPLLEWARRVGFDGIDIADSWLNWHAMSDQELKELRQQLDELGLPCCALNPYRCVLARHPEAAANERKLERAVEVASILGAEVVNLALSVPFPAVWSDQQRAERQRQLARGEHYDEADFADTADRLRRLADRASLHGVALSIELHDDGMTDRSEHVLRLHGLVDHPAVGVNPDLQNGYRVPYATESWRAAVENLAERTNFWHVKSCTRRYDPASGSYVSGRATLRDGDIDYRWALTRIVQAGFDGWISVESGGGDALLHCEEDLRYLRALIKDWLPIALGRETPRRRGWGWAG